MNDKKSKGIIFTNYEGIDEIIYDIYEEKITNPFLKSFLKGCIFDAIEYDEKPKTESSMAYDELYNLVKG